MYGNRDWVHQAQYQSSEILRLVSALLFSLSLIFSTSVEINIAHYELYAWIIENICIKYFV